jgi:uncharacterized SAM-binding protein YcdF (DUF218 family)
LKLIPFKVRLRYKIILGIIVIALLIGLTSFYKIFLYPLDIGEAIPAGYGDAILVLGGGLRPKVEIGYSTQERLDLAIELYRQRKRPVIVSDGSLYRRSPAIEIIAKYLTDRGVESTDIILEGKSQTTFDNFYFSKKIIDARGFKQIIVCTSPYHQRRSRLIMHYVKFGDFKLARMGRSEIYQAGTITQRWRNLRLILREYVAVIKFKLLKR